MVFNQKCLTNNTHRNTFRNKIYGENDPVGFISLGLSRAERLWEGLCFNPLIIASSGNWGQSLRDTEKLFLIERSSMLSEIKGVNAYNVKSLCSKIRLTTCTWILYSFPVVPLAKPQGTISVGLTLKCNYHGNKLWLTVGLSNSHQTRCNLKRCWWYTPVPQGLLSAMQRVQKLWIKFRQHDPATSCLLYEVR